MTRKDASKKKALEVLLNPESIAIVGASEKPSYGGRLLRNLIKSGYRGKIYPINTKYKKIFGLECYPSVSEVPSGVDVVVYAIGRRFIMDILDECFKKGVKSVVIIAAGFSEADEKGKILEMKIKEFAQETNIGICGPNCFGIANFVENVIASPERDMGTSLMGPGKIGLVSQSGALAFCSLYHYARDRGIGLSYVISGGNEVDFEIADYVLYLIEDPNTKVIAIFVEGLKDAEKFLEATNLAQEKGKPIVALKVGRSKLGQKSAVSHTGSMTGSDLVYEAVFKQRGVIRTYDLDELIEISNVLSNYELPSGNGVVVVSTSGGFATYLADLCEDLGLNLPEISGKTLQKLLAIEELLTFGKLRNPADIRGQGFSVLTKVLSPLTQDQKYDVIVLAMATALPHAVDDIVEISKSTAKPIFVIWKGRKEPRSGERLEELGFKILQKNKIPVFFDPYKCLRTIRSYFEYAAFSEKWTMPHKQSAKTSQERLRKIANRMKSKRGLLDYSESAWLLSEYKIPLAEAGIARTVEEATLVAEEIGYPIALKALSREIPHKTDIGAIRIDIRDSTELIQRYEEILENVKRHNSRAKVDGLLVQEMVENGVETIVGIARDAQFGPIILFGLGGVLVETLKDYSIRLPPLSKKEAYEMIGETKALKVLEGFRGKPKADIDSVVDILTNLSKLAVDHEKCIAEIDINPLIVKAEGGGARAVDVRVRLGR